MVTPPNTEPTPANNGHEHIVGGEPCKLCGKKTKPAPSASLKGAELENKIAGIMGLKMERNEWTDSGTLHASYKVREIITLILQARIEELRHLPQIELQGLMSIRRIVHAPTVNRRIKALERELSNYEPKH